MLWGGYIEAGDMERIVNYMDEDHGHGDLSLPQPPGMMCLGPHHATSQSWVWTIYRCIMVYIYILYYIIYYILYFIYYYYISYIIRIRIISEGSLQSAFVAGAFRPGQRPCRGESAARGFTLARSEFWGLHQRRRALGPHRPCDSCDSCEPLADV
jgi:hypothetical protein